MMTIAEMGSGGAETLVAEMARELGRDGHRVSLVSNGGWRAEQLRDEDGVATSTAPLHASAPTALVRSSARIARLARRAPVDVVHAHNVRASLVARVGTNGRSDRRPPVLTTLHGLAAADYPRAARVLRWSSDLVVAVSDSVAADLVAAGFPTSRLRVIENAVPAPEPVDRAVARRTLGLSDAGSVVLCVARMTPQKRHDLLLAAWARHDDPHAVLLVAGDGPRAADLRAQADGLGLGSRVRFLGTRADVDVLLAAADVAVLPSDWEGLPVAVLEAMAAGVPVVASDVGGLRELGHVVALVPPGSVSALTTTLSGVLADPALRAGYADAGRTLVRSRFDPVAMQQAYLAAYAHVRWGRRGGTGLDTR